MNTDNPAQTFGQKAVGATFNPSQSTLVDEIKNRFAAVIDLLALYRAGDDVTDEQKRMYSIAITDAQAACMWAVKSATWKE